MPMRTMNWSKLLLILPSMFLVFLVIKDPIPVDANLLAKLAKGQTTLIS